MSDAPAVEISANGQTSAATRLWRFQDQLRVTVILKATFTLVHQALMKLAPPDPILRQDVHQGNNPVRSVRLTDDLAPYLPGTDVLLTGHAHAPPGTRAPWVTAGIALYDKYDCFFEKYLDICGDPGPDGITPFQKMPIVWERTFGGPGWEDNPFGVGAGGAKGAPNIHYVGQRGRSASFGPMSAHWPARKRLVSAETRKALALPIADIPEGFDWSYFHAAPPDQRCTFLTGSEWLVLQGLHPAERRVRSRLPAVRGLARVFFAGEEALEQGPLELTADTLRIDSDRGVCSITWRKSFAVWEEAQLADLAILTAVQIGEQTVKWPAPPPVPEKPVAPAASFMGTLSAARPMILGSFRLAVFSPEPAEGDEGAEELEDLDDYLAPEEPTTAGLDGDDRLSPVDAESMATTMVIRAAASTGATAPGAAPGPKTGPAGTLLLVDSPDDDVAGRDALVPPPGPHSGPPDPPRTEALALLGRTASFEDRRSTEPTTGSHQKPLARPRSSGHRGGPLRRTGTNPAVPRFPKPAGARLELTDLAAVAAALAETGAPRGEVLSTHDLSEADWMHDQKRWSRAFREAARGGDRRLIDAFDAAYVAAWEAIRGPVGPADYACLSVASERGDRASMLAALKLRNATWRRLRRVWARRMMTEPALARAVREAEAALR